MHEAILTKFKKEVLFTCPYSAIEDLIKAHFGIKDFSVPCDEECGNDVSLEFRLDGKMSDYDQRELADILSGRRRSGFRTRTLLNFLVSEGVLEPGKYLIRVSW